METSPAAFFRFAAEHHELLVDLFRRRSFTEGELHEVIRRHERPTHANTVHVAEQLQSLGVIEPAPEATSRLEITRPVASFLEFLLREHRLSSANVIQGYLADLSELSTELEHAIRMKHDHGVERALQEVADEVDQIRQDSHANRVGITDEALKLKTNREHRPARLRYETVNRLWDRYIVPLRDLLDTSKAMDAALDRLLLIVQEGQTVYEGDSSMAREFASLRARLIRLRRDAGADHVESVKEISPLHESLRRDTLLVRGASTALERLGREGVTALDVFDLKICSWRREGLLRDAAVEAFLRNISGYEPAPPGPLPEMPTSELPATISDADLHERLSAAGIIPDVLGWLTRQFPTVSLSEILRARASVGARMPHARRSDPRMSDDVGVSR